MRIGTRLHTIACMALLFGAAHTVAQTLAGTEFNYQGQLKLAGMDVNDTADFEFTLWRDAVSVAPSDVVGSTTSVNNVTVADGRFTVELDFGVDPFDGQALWLEIAVRSPAGGGLFTTLSPRQALTPAPYALSLRGFRTRASGDSEFPGSWNVLGGHSANFIAPEVSGATISGGGGVGDLDAASEANRVLAENGTIGGGSRIVVTSEGGTVCGGTDNRAAAPYASVGGGTANWANSAADGAAIGGGYLNQAYDSYATISGGTVNDSFGYASTISGGLNNVTIGSFATVGGGSGNQAVGSSATVSGGIFNDSSGSYSTIGGGLSNYAAGYASTIPGGNLNYAGGDYSFAGGRRAVVVDAVTRGDSDGDQGTFVWADSTDADFISTGPDQFLIRASGGVGVGTNAPDAGILDVQQVSDSPTGGIAVSNTSNTAMRLWVDGNAVGHIDTNWFLSLNSGAGGVGIGTDDPAGALHVEGDDVPQLIVHQSETSGADAGIVVRGSRFSSAPDVDVAYLELRDFDENEGGGTDFAMARIAAGQQTISGQKGLLRFATNDGLGVEERVRITSDGRVGIGTTTPDFGRLDVQQATDGAGQGIAVTNTNNNSMRIWVDGNNVRRIDAGAGGTEPLTLNNGGGNLGIGTTSPAGTLHVETDLNPNITFENSGAVGANRAVSVNFNHSNGTGAEIRAQRFSGNNDGMYLSFATEPVGGSLTDRMRISPNGDVGIGTSSPSERLHVAGNICATGTIGACSDARFKENVTSLGDALATLARLRGVSFDWKRAEFPDREFSDQRQVGFIAQEVANVIPQIVNKGNDGYYSVDYGRLTPLLVEAIKDLDEQNRAKDEQLAQLLIRIQRLEEQSDPNPSTPEVNR